MVAVADRAVSGGSPVSVEDIRFVPIESGFEALDSLLSEPAFADREGWVVSRSIGEGELIALGDLIEPAVRGDLRSMSLPIEIEHAAGGSLITGDRVDVITVTDGVPSYVVADVEVISVPAETGSSIGGFGDYHVVVAVDDQEALRLAGALDSGSLEIVRATGAEAVEVDGVGGDS
jgi:Flp pilus assembly protein CpaB